MSWRFTGAATSAMAWESGPVQAESVPGPGARRPPIGAPPKVPGSRATLRS
jgi:hypothetical protein